MAGLRSVGWMVLATLWVVTVGAPGRAAELSSATEDCIGCHEEVTPGIVADWRASRHSHVSPAEALQKAALQRRVSAARVPEELADTAVGCAECHTQSPDRHKDTFEHNGYRVHVVVTPENCATCHPEERSQYAENLMANAYGNLVENPVYQSLAEAVNGLQVFNGHGTDLKPTDRHTAEDSCLSCHGTKTEVVGFGPRDTAMGEMVFPQLLGWPNVGVGRLNPDGSKGSCSSCHARHQFSIEVARKPATCSQCHKGPDVPAYPVYLVSKHGNIYSSVEKQWDFDAVPWTPGKDFTAPTCAACHVSLLADDGGEVIARRSHKMSDRLPHRLFGTIYATAHPKSADTTIIRNASGLPLPVELTGEPASAFLIDAAEQKNRREVMERVCASCHGREWIDGHFRRADHTIETSNAMTLEATRIVLKAWEEGLAKGLAQDDSIFNEAIERLWVEQWLFYANSIRFASAMGGADYGVFANGRWLLSKNLQEMVDYLDFLRTARKPSE